MTKKSLSFSLAVVLLVVTLELSFINKLWVTIYAFLVAVGFLLYKKRWRAALACLVLPLLPAVANYWSIAVQGTRPELAPVIFWRSFAFASLGLVFAFGIDLEELLLTLEQKGLPANLVYGLLVVVHALPELQAEVKQIREASLLRGQKLHVWSPYYYLKVIFTAYQWQDLYHQALLVHGYDEGKQRQPYERYRQDRRGLLWLLSLVVLGHILMIF